MIPESEQPFFIKTKLHPVLRVFLAFVLFWLVILWTSMIFSLNCPDVFHQMDYLATFNGLLLNQAGTIGSTIILMMSLVKNNYKIFHIYGFNKPEKEWLVPVVITGLILGVIGSFVGGIIAEGGITTPFQDFTIFQHIIAIYILGPVTEELLFRGLILAFLSPLSVYGIKLSPTSSVVIGAPVLIAAGIFSLSHLFLSVYHIQLQVVVYNLIFTFFVGNFAGYWRERTGSLIPAIVFHSLANFGGSILWLAYRQRFQYPLSYMRTPVEIWIKQHKDAYRHADELVTLLAPSDIQSQLVNPENTKLRQEVARHLHAFVEFADGHFRDEENHLLPLIKEHLNLHDPKIADAIGCLTREHEQMHLFIERMKPILSTLESGDVMNPHDAGELLRIAYGIQSLIRHHCTKEEREVYSLVSKLPIQAVDKLFNEILKGEVPDDDIKLDHLIQPLGKPGNSGYGEGIDGPEN